MTEGADVGQDVGAEDVGEEEDLLAGAGVVDGKHVDLWCGQSNPPDSSMAGRWSSESVATYLCRVVLGFPQINAVEDEIVVLGQTLEDQGGGGVGGDVVLEEVLVVGFGRGGVVAVQGRVEDVAGLGIPARWMTTTTTLVTNPIQLFTHIRD